MAEPTLFDEASLALIASGGAGKDGKVYSIKPTTGDGDFTFSRGSNLAATRVGADGLIEKGRENLLLQSNNFDTSPWIQSLGASGGVISGQIGYDGTNDAWKINSKGALYPYVHQSVSQSGVHTFSVYAKRGDVDFIRLLVIGGSNPDARFDLFNGTAPFVSGGALYANIEPVGTGGWYRCSLAVNIVGSSYRIYPMVDTGTFAPIDEGIYVQNAQLEIGLAATDYIESGATTGKAGLLEDEPRFDYSGGATCPSLLLEPSRTNLVEQSEYFNSYSKLTSDATSVPVVTDNYSISPEGLQNAARVVMTKPATDNDYAIIREVKSIAKTSGDKMSQSVYLKATDASQIGKIVDIYAYDGSYLSVKNHTLTSEWERVETIHTASIGTSNTEIVIGKARGSAGGTTLTNMATDFLVYGHQFELGSYPTSYIPNHSGGSVTRGADECTGAGDATTFNDNEGVLYLEISALANDGTFRGFTISDNGDPSDRVTITINSNIDSIRAIVKSNNATSFDESYNSVNVLNDTKIAMKYAQDNFALFINGVKRFSDTSGNTPVGLNVLNFNAGSTALPFYGNVKQVLVFKEALSDTELIKLTTI